MAVRFASLALLLSACGGATEDGVKSPQSLVGRWEEQAQIGAKLEECLLKAQLPNPLDISLYQRLVDEVLSTRTKNNVPIFFTYNSNNILYIILSRECDKSLQFAATIESRIHEHSILQHLTIDPVSATEARSIVSQIEVF